jgi:hypothetical protein
LVPVPRQKKGGEAVEIFSPRFTVGWLILTPGALFALVEAQEDPKSFISRHLKGDWGDVDPALWAADQYATVSGFFRSITPGTARLPRNADDPGRPPEEGLP